MQTATTRVLMVLAIAVMVPCRALSQTDSADRERHTLEVEAGPAWFSRNDVRIPNDSGTRFDLRDLTGSGPELNLRLHSTWRLNERHSLRVTLAPLSSEGSGRLEDDTVFAGADFSAAAPVKGEYRFSTYRATWRYRFHEGERWDWGVGAALLVRDARIRLTQGMNTAQDDDLGVVPLLHLHGRYRLAAGTDLVVDVEGAAASQGRAVDAIVKLEHRLSPDWHVSAGYRMLEGGADNDDLYTFAWIHYATLGVGYRF